MAIHNSTKGGTGRPSPRTQQNFTFPSPMNGMDARVPISSDNPRVCLYCFNIVPSEYGLRVRSGFREWQIDIEDEADTSVGVTSIIPFESSTDNNAEDRLFVATAEGIWDVTTEGGTPILKIEFTLKTPDAGKGNYAHYLNDAGNDVLFYADGENGLYQYDSVTDAWSIPTGITGVTVSAIDFVVVHKQRVWFCELGSTIGYYLPVGSQSGEAEPFNFGAKFKHGGSLIGLYNWTVDGGDGVDDYLIAVSSSGDVLPYRGSDPTQSDWALVGTYSVGSMALGHRAVSQYGGNMYMLSTYGITQMSDLLRGVDPRLPNEDSVGARVAPLIRLDMNTYRSEYGWDIRYLQSEGVVIVTTPFRLNGEYIQYVYNRAVDGWGFWRGVPINCIDTWQSSVYFGTKDNRVMVMDVSKDNILLDPEGPNNGDLIKFSMLFNYQSFGEKAVYKRGLLIRPDFLSTEPMAYTAKFLYDYNRAELQAVPPLVATTDGVWDVSFWDDAVWGSNDLELNDMIIGGSGIGRLVSVAIRGDANTGTVLASTDATWNAGWFL